MVRLRDREITRDSESVAVSFSLFGEQNYVTRQTNQKRQAIIVTIHEIPDGHQITIEEKT